MWEKISVSRRLDTLCGSFSFETSDRKEFPISTGDLVEIYINNNRFLKGFIFSKPQTGDSNSNNVIISGRDITADIVDSSIPSNAKNIDGTTDLVTICKNVIAGLGLNIPVIDESGVDLKFNEESLHSGMSGGNVWDMLQGFSRQKQVVLRTSNDGELIIYKPAKVFAKDSLINKVGNLSNNILSWNIKDAQDDRYNQYHCLSQDNFASYDTYDEDGSNRGSTVLDNGIRKTRMLEIIAEESFDDDECKKRASEEANIRRAQGKQYICSVPTPIQSDGSLWTIGDLVKINDDLAGIHGNFLLDEIKCSQDIIAGTKTYLTFTLPDAYQAIAEESDLVKRKINFEN